EQVLWPVITAVATTIAAFLPLMLMEGQMGDFMRWLPTVVAAALFLSLVEALFIMPSHLAEWMKPRRSQPVKGASAESAAGLSLRDRFHFSKKRITHEIPMRLYTSFARVALRYRYVTIWAAVCVLLSVFSYAGAYMKFQLLPEMDADRILIDITMPVGTPTDKTREVLEEVEFHCVEMEELLNVAGTLGSQMRIGHAGAEGFRKGSNLAQLWLELKEPEERTRSSEEITADLRQRFSPIEGVDSLVVKPLRGGPAGKEIEIELSSDDLQALTAASHWLKDLLATFRGVKDVEDSHRPGKPEIQLKLKEEGRALGLTVESLARQVRGAFFGLEASKVQRQREEVKVYVRLPPEFRRTVGDLESMPIATPEGGLVPLRRVALMTAARSPVEILRRDRHRTIVVTADVDQRIGNTAEITTAVEERSSELVERWPDVSARFKGARLETEKSVGSLFKAFCIALLIVYALLASVFKSYVQPLIVMSAIPFAYVGVILGHKAFGFHISLPTLIGAVALTGIVVNDSLILVDFVNNELRSSPGNTEGAVLKAARIRMRPIILTSVTTVLGLLPMLTETSLQARFLIPMAVSIAFGLAFATIVTLILVPCLYLVLNDATSLLRSAVSWAGFGVSTPGTVHEEADHEPR
ncbi:efflux RND transporter permease subunit, partial [Planctomycetota bacterium]